MLRKRIFTNLTLVIAFALFGDTLSMNAQSSGAPPPEPATSLPSKVPAPQTQGDMLIGSGDLLEVSVFGAPDSAKQMRVSPTGEISLPLIGAVKVGGLSVS